MLNILRIIMDKVDSMGKQMGNKTEENSKKEPKRNTRSQEHCGRNENAFDGLVG